jgi:hypothetical protein
VLPGAPTGDERSKTLHRVGFIPLHRLCRCDIVAGHPDELESEAGEGQCKMRSTTMPTGHDKVRCNLSNRIPAPGLNLPRSGSTAVLSEWKVSRALIIPRSSPVVLSEILWKFFSQVSSRPANGYGH